MLHRLYLRTMTYKHILNFIYCMIIYSKLVYRHTHH